MKFRALYFQTNPIWRMEWIITIIPYNMDYSMAYSIDDFKIASHLPTEIHPQVGLPVEKYRLAQTAQLGPRQAEGRSILCLLDLVMFGPTT